jgi:tetratricopeptide (TPR) repeat protein
MRRDWLPGSLADAGPHDVSLPGPQYDRAIEDFDQAIRINPDDAMAVLVAYLGRGATKSTKGDFAEAAADLAKARQLRSGIGK